jgi:hypothetical protein
MTVTLPSDDFEVARRREAAIHWGWPFFLSGGLGCALVSYLLYLWVEDGSVGMIRFLVDGFLCVPFCLVSCIGFIQVVSGTTCEGLRGVWRSLALWRRLLILLFVMVAIVFLASFTCFLWWMAPAPHVNGNL